MASTPTTLSDFLCVGNPKVNNVRCKPGKNTNSSKKKWKQPQFIEDWKDFDCEGMRCIYDGLLQELLDDQYDFRVIHHPSEYPSCWIAQERDLEAQVLVPWNFKVVEEALKQSQDRLQGRVARGNVHMVLGSQAAQPAPYLNPDWAGIQGEPVDPSDQSLPENILPGDTKLSKKWQSRDIEKGEVTKTYHKTDWLRPIAQIYTYCVQSGKRYGYLITDKELLATRILPVLDGDKDDSVSRFNRQSTKPISGSPVKHVLHRGIMECKAIPWHFPETHSRNELTVNMAIWYLHMLAAENCGIEDHYRPLKHEKYRVMRSTNETAPPEPEKKRKRRNDEVPNISTSSNTRGLPRKKRRPMSRESTQALSFTST